MWLAREDHTVELCLTIDYGQRSASVERSFAQRHARRFGLPWRVIEMPWLADAARRGGCALVPGGGDLPRGASDDAPGTGASAAAVWVPARNLVFVAAAASYAEALGAGFVLAGFNREEAETFPDNSATFVAACDEVLRFATLSGVRVSSPTIDLVKAGIVAEARRQGMTAADFWSCYGAGPKPCEDCESCVRSRRAWLDREAEN